MGSPLTVSHDSDGGITVKDSRTGVVVSIISKGPDDAPLLYVEPYAFRARRGALVYALTARPVQ